MAGVSLPVVVVSLFTAGVPLLAASVSLPMAIFSLFAASVISFPLSRLLEPFYSLYLLHRAYHTVAFVLDVHSGISIY